MNKVQNHVSVCCIGADRSDELVCNPKCGHESLNPAKPKVVVYQATQYIGIFLDADKNPVNNGFSTCIGTIGNKHSYERYRFFEIQNVVFELPLEGNKPKLVNRRLFFHPDCVWIDTTKIDGLPKAVKKRFALPCEGQEITVVSETLGSIAQGRVLQVTDIDVVIDASTEKGDCSAPYLDNNGHVVAFHYEGSSSVRTQNRGMAVTPAFLAEFDSLPSKK
jgi:hypothetical protein